jgi:phosphoadenosine phosphosulfate reductase
VDRLAPLHESDPEEIGRAAIRFARQRPQQVLQWGIDRYRAGITLACSFGAEDVVLVDMIARIDPAVPIFYLDTDYLFPETLAVRDRLVERYGVRPIAVRPELTIDQQASRHGADLFDSRPDLCCSIRKVEPLRKHLTRYRSWITGIRRDQAPARANAGLVEWDSLFNLVKLNPLAPWTSSDVWDYIRANDVPYNELHDRDYPSIGCWPCTRQILPGEDPRAGRWANFAKQECGLHDKTEPAPAGS